MCGRYYIEIDGKDMREIIAAVESGTQTRAGEVFPTNIAPVIGPQGAAAAMQWGFPRFSGKGQIINARSETAAEKPMFRRAMASGRCLVPASWYFEWRKDGSKKIKYELALPERRTMYFAGLSQMTGDGLAQFVILTRPAWAGIANIHDRMPVILPEQVHDAWLHSRDPEAVIKQAVDRVEARPA